MGYGLGGAGAAALNAHGRQARHRAHGRRRLLAQRPRLERRQCRLQQERQRADRGRQRLFGRDRRTGHALLRRRATACARPGTRSRRRCAASASNWVRTLTRTYDVAKMRDTLREALTTADKGPKVIIAQSECMLNKQRRVRPLMRKRMRRRQARGARALRRRPRHLHRRSFLHPAVGLPVAHARAQSRSAAARAGDQGDQLLRRLRPVRRGRACRGAVPVVLPRLDHRQPDRAGIGSRTRCAAP